MTGERLDVARRLVADPRWKDRPNGTNVQAWLKAQRGLSTTYRDHVTGIRWRVVRGEWLPDLDDIGTGGVLLGMLLDAVGDWRDVVAVSFSSPTDVDIELAPSPDDVDAGCLYRGLFRGGSLAEAAGLALLAVWGQG